MITPKERLFVKRGAIMHARGRRLLLSVVLLLFAIPVARATDPVFLGPPPYGNPYFEWKASRGKGRGACVPVAHSAAAPAQGGVAPENVPPIAVIEIHVPTGAEVWVDDQKSRQTGSKRVFRSPQLERGKTFQYTVRARWISNKLPVEQTQQISVEAGGRVVIDFTQP
jgi:uncharacterized protein (TIGR03000 family)